MPRLIFFALIALLSPFTASLAQDKPAEPRKLTSSGCERTYHLHVPPSLDRAQPAPLLFVFHGAGGNGLSDLGAYHWLADRDGFLLVGPDGLNKRWNAGVAPVPKGRSETRRVGTTETAAFTGSRAGDEREVSGVRVCWCPPGTFTMGSPPSEPGRRTDEKQVKVTLTKGFWMGKYEVTQGQWKMVAGEIPGKLIAGEGNDFPVYWVSFIAAEEFCRKLTEQARASRGLPEGWEFRLPTEAQWEYACRAGTTTAFSCGDSLTSQQANIGKPYDGTPDGTPGAAAVRVGSYPSNAWRLHDMHGNEFEWCRDWYHSELPGGNDPDLSGRKGVANRDGTFSRVRRGGAWTDSEKFCRSALRLRYEPERNSDHIGFRIVLIQP